VNVAQSQSKLRRIVGRTVCIMVVVWPTIGLAEPTSHLTSESLVAEVLRANASIAAARASQQALAAEARRADTLADPQFRYAIAPKSVNDRAVDTGHIVGLSQPLPWPGKLALRRAQAEFRVDAAGYELADARRQLAFEARLAYADYAYLVRALRINAEQQQALDTLVRLAEKRYAAGRGTQQEPLAAQVRLLRLREMQWELEAQRDAARARINALRQATPGAPLAEPGGIPWRAEVPPFERVVQAAVRAHPALARLDAETRAAEAAVELEQLARRPDVTLSANYLGTLPREEYRGQLGIAFHLPFGQQKHNAGEAAAAARVERARAQQSDLRHRLRADARTAYAQWQAADRSRRLYRRELSSLAEQSRETALALYSRGTGDVQAVIDAETEWLSVRTGWLRSRRDAFQALARLAFITGGRMDGQLLPEPRS